MSDNAAAEQAMKEAALVYHEQPTPGKLAIRVTKPMTTARAKYRALSRYFLR